MLKLDVVNRCIGTLGEAPLLTLDEVHTFAPAALNMLELSNQEVQAPGRWFNSELLTLTPSGYDSGLYLPGDTLEVVTGDARYVQRGDRIYNLDTGDFVFHKPLKVFVIRLVDFDDVPAVAQAAIATRALLRFQTVYDGDRQRTEMIGEEARAAWLEFGRAEIRNRKVNMIENNPGLQRLLRHTRGIRTGLGR